MNESSTEASLVDDAAFVAAFSQAFRPVSAALQQLLESLWAAYRQAGAPYGSGPAGMADWLRAQSIGDGILGEVERLVTASGQDARCEGCGAPVNFDAEGLLFPWGTFCTLACAQEWPRRPRP